jgi:hypothetical protein
MKCASPVHLGLAPQFALPDLDSRPSQGTQVGYGNLIAPTIGRDLLFPELCASLWQTVQVTLMSMPEAAMHEDYGSELGENDVGCSRHTFDVQTEPQPCLVQLASNKPFDYRTLGPDAGHQG